MKTTYIANTTEAANLYSGKQTAIVTLVKPQPEYRENESIKGHYGTFFHGWNIDHELFNLTDIQKYFPYQPGSTIAVRESWNIESWDCQGYIRLKYKDGGTKEMDCGLYDDEDKETNLYISLSDHLESINCPKDDNGNYIDFNLPWRSPATMPREAVRTHLLVKDVQCVRVQDMTSEQAQAIWPEMNNIQRMQDLHRKFGSGTWDNNVFIFITTVEKK